MTEIEKARAESAFLEAMARDWIAYYGPPGPICGMFAASNEKARALVALLDKQEEPKDDDIRLPVPHVWTKWSDGVYRCKCGAFGSESWAGYCREPEKPPMPPSIARVLDLMRGAYDNGNPFAALCHSWADEIEAAYRKEPSRE